MLLVQINSVASCILTNCSLLCKYINFVFSHFGSAYFSMQHFAREVVFFLLFVILEKYSIIHVIMFLFELPMYMCSCWSLFMSGTKILYLGVLCLLIFSLFFIIMFFTLFIFTPIFKFCFRNFLLRVFIMLCVYGKDSVYF